MKTMTKEEWYSKGVELFGENEMVWKFVCPVCGYVQTPQEYKDAGAPSSTVAFSCVGRWFAGSKRAFGDKDKPGPCDYAGGGLFRVHKLEVDGHPMFEFWEDGNER